MAIFEKSNFSKSKFQGSKIEKLAPIVAKWEGGYVNDPLDRGGAINMGVTVNAWKLLGYDKNGDGIINDTDMKLLSKDDFKYVNSSFSNKVIIPYGGHTGILWHKEISKLMVDKIEEGGTK